MRVSWRVWLRFLSDCVLGVRLIGLATRLGLTVSDVPRNIGVGRRRVRSLMRL